MADKAYLEEAGGLVIGSEDSDEDMEVELKDIDESMVGADGKVMFELFWQPRRTGSISMHLLSVDVSYTLRSLHVSQARDAQESNNN